MAPLEGSIVEAVRQPDLESRENADQKIPQMMDMDRLPSCSRYSFSTIIIIHRLWIQTWVEVPMVTESCEYTDRVPVRESDKIGVGRAPISATHAYSARQGHF